MKQYELVAITDEVTTCGECGRTDLKKTLFIRNTADGSEQHYGSECAERALSLNHKELNGMVNGYRRQQREAAEQAQRELAWRIAQHPLMVQRDAEITAFWAQTPRPDYGDAPHARWAQMERQARMEATQ